MIGIIDYGLSNISSITNAVLKLNYKCEAINNRKEFGKFDKIILPGVGSFPKAI